METVQLQCGNCQKLMAISVEHLGSQVHCPHCRAVVQTPARTAFAPAAPEPVPPPAPPPVFEQHAGDDLFGPAAETTDALFGDAEDKPGVEMPAEPPRPSQPPSAPPPAEAFSPVDPLPFGHEAPTPPRDTAHASHEDEADLTALKPRQVSRSSMFVPMLLIFLIPWSIFWPAVAIYFWYQAREMSNAPHPLDTLPDPVPGKGGVREVMRVKHDSALAASQKTTLRKPLRIGDVEVTPKKVSLNDNEDLVLVLGVKNVSENLIFTPMHDKFLGVTERQGKGKPYTFVESKEFDPLYGGYLEFRRGDREIDWSRADLKPGQEEEVVLTTLDKYRPTVQKLTKSASPLVWRVQLRRGYVQHRGKLVPVTAVVGVEFTPLQIERAGGGKDA